MYLHDNNEERYFVIEARNIGIVGSPKFETEIIFSGNYKDCVEFENAKRMQYDPDRVTIDCYIKSETEIIKHKLAKMFWDSLTDEEKSEVIYVNGKKYNKAMYEFHNGKYKK